MTLKVLALAGGVGGAKLADGLYRALSPGSLTVVVNTADDFEHLGLYISPDVDTVCYTLAGLANPETGWGRADETWHALENLKALGGPAWFNLGDRDLGTHLERTRRLKRGDSLSAITADFCSIWGVQAVVLPMSDDPVATIVETAEGDLPFQEYFVARRCEPEVSGFRFAGIGSARPAAAVLPAIAEADLVVICPSNPWVSVDPILALPGLREALGAKPVIAVSPIIGGQAVKGPAAKMYRELGIEPSALAVAQHYEGLLTGFVFDRVDKNQAESIRALGIIELMTDTLMKSPDDRRRLAQEILEFGQRLSASTPTRTRQSNKGMST
jgi:LPPG:FO 2-phospho-L-lactate transferase